MRVRKTDLVAEIAEKTGLTKKASALALDAVVSSLESHFVEGDVVPLHGFGIFATSIGNYPASPPGTAKSDERISRNVLRFRPSPRLKSILNPK